MLAKANPNVVIGAALLAFLGVLGGLLGLYAVAPAKPNVAPLFAAIPGGLAFLTTLVVTRVQRSHSAQLATIGKNTNGVLTQRITDSVNAAVPVAVATALASANVVAVVPKQPTPATAPDATAPADVPAVSTGA